VKKKKMKKKNNLAISTIIAVIIALSILVAFSATASATTTWYVDDGTCPSSGSGTQTDPYCKIQDAIDAASAGDTISVADGTYTITSKILVNKEGLTITGDVNTPENVVVQYSSLTSSLIFDMRASNAVIEGFKTTNGKSGFWFDQSGVTGCTISHCIVDAVAEYGIYMKNGGSGHTIEYTTISNTGQTYAGAPAVLIENSLDVTLNGNTLSSISDKGIYVRVCSATSADERVEVTGNTISGCVYPCIQVYQSPYTIVDGNTISSTDDKGINIIGPNADSEAERVELTNNIISGCPYDAILVTHDSYTYIHGNTVGPTGDKGISIADGENINNVGERIEVSGNTVTGTKYPGIQVAWAVPYTYIYDNTLTGCNYYGGDGTGDWDYASIHVDENCYNTIVDSNDVSDGINGIQIWSDDCEVTNNEIYDMGMTYANIHDNYWGLYVRDYPSVLSVTAENNWWGDCSGPYHSTTNPSGTGDAVSDNVDYGPWSFTPDPCEPKTIGFWKTHEDSVDAVLEECGPISLGDYSVVDAQAVFDNAKNKNANTMLAAQLLAAKLNVAHLEHLEGIDYCECIDDVISDADTFLSNHGYKGPDEPGDPPRGDDKEEANGYKGDLDVYNQGLCPCT
jgi:hypothetical protein